MEIKPGVSLAVIPQIRTALQKIDAIFGKYGFNPVVTSGRDSKHSKDSLHYRGAAVDIRSKGLPLGDKASILNEMKAVFPMPPWYVILESPGSAIEHFHIQIGLAVRDTRTGRVVRYEYVP